MKGINGVGKGLEELADRADGHSAGGCERLDGFQDEIGVVAVFGRAGFEEPRHDCGEVGVAIDAQFALAGVFALVGRQVAVDLDCGGLAGRGDQIDLAGSSVSEGAHDAPAADDLPDAK